MRSTTIISLGLSVVLALMAVIGVRSYLANRSAFLTAANSKSVINTIVVATQPLRFGKLIEPTSLKVIDWPAATLPEGSFKTIDEVIGDSGQQRYAMAAIEKDEPILTSKITGPGQRATLSATLSPGMKAVSIRVNDVLGVAGFVLPGDRVDIMWTRELKESQTGANNSFVDVLLQGVKVLAVDQSADDRSDKPSVVKTATFEVSTEEAQKLTLAANIGTLSLALRNVASSEVETVKQLKIGDLTGGNAAEALKAEAGPSPSDVRLENIERLVRQVGETVAKPIIMPVAEPAPQPEPEPIVVPEPPKPVTSIVTVIRNGKREDYTVKPMQTGSTY